MLVPASNDMDSFFVNISDGEPCFSNRDINYGGMDAAEHTRKQVNKIRQNGVGVLSYFVTDNSYGSNTSIERFKKMYGADSKFININSIGEVTATLNKMFLTK
jgi:nitric oxide reductase activation protein